MSIAIKVIFYKKPCIKASKNTHMGILVVTKLHKNPSL